ncbi:MAG: RNA polymerase sigma factor [Bacteroidales bacterium]|jgi:RNA polymerase sigma factor (sigma-70 family)|nr:RNA polymerase sigma factor [Bacteroidales bacterium]
MNKKEFWDDAYRRNAPALRGVIRRYISDNELIQDLIQEAFITAINKQDTYSGKGSFDGWLHRITVNTALMHLRSRKPAMVPIDSMSLVAETNDEAIENTKNEIEAAEFSNNELLEAVDHLPEHHRLVFNMYVMDGFTHVQIGKELGISSGTSKSHLARARKKLQQYLHEEALKKKKDKKRAVAFLAIPVLSGKMHYIDKLYQSNMSGFTIPGSGDLSFLSVALEQPVASTLSTVVQTTASSFQGSVLSYVAACGVTAAITTSVCLVTLGDEPVKNESVPQNVILLADSIVQKTDQDTTLNLFLEQEDTSAENINLNLQDAVQDVQIVVSDSPEEKESKVLSSRSEVSDIPDPPVDEKSFQEEESSPFVVKKQIIQHQTVVIRDTIIIEE